MYKKILGGFFKMKKQYDTPEVSTIYYNEDVIMMSSQNLGNDEWGDYDDFN